MFWRMVFAMVGVLVGAGVAPHLVELAGGGRGGYSVMGFQIAIACGLAMLVSFVTVRHYHARDLPVTAQQGEDRAGLRRLLANRDYVRLWLSYVLAISGASLLLALVPYYITQVMGYGEGDAGTALFVLLAGTIISLPMWSKLLARWGGWPTYALAIAVYVAFAAVFAFLPRGLELHEVVPVFFMLGLPFGGMQLLPFTLLAHVAHKEAQLGARQEGLYTGLWTAGEKLSLAIGPAAAGLGLTLTGYVPGAVAQSSETLSGLQLVMGLGPTVFMVPPLVLCIAQFSTRAGQAVA
jgi:GPH family glycoside/pentoside/hexuronide:cation symporter